MRKVTIIITEDDQGQVRIAEIKPPFQECASQFNNSEIIGLLTQFVHSKVSAMNGGG